MTDAETLDVLAEIMSTARSHPSLAVGQVLNLVLVQRMTSLTRQMAEVNGVADRVVVAGACGHFQLRDLAGENTLIVCDCEGRELQLPNPQEAPGLAASDLLVEMHDFLEPRTSRLLPSRFGQTNEVAIIPHSGRNPYSLSVLREMNQLDQWLAVWEGRPAPTPWAWMIPQRDSDLRLTSSG